jgi:hypothetical protein
MKHHGSKSLLLLLTLFLVGAIPLLADSDDPPTRVARLAYLQGAVSIQPASVNQWSQASSNYPIATGDRIYADQDGRAELQIGQTVARLWHGTDVTMTNLNDAMTQFGLAQGTFRLRTFGLDPAEQVEVDTPNGALTVVRPGDVRIDAYPGDEGTVVTVNSGEVQITGPGFSQQVGSGQSIRLVGSNPIESAFLGMAPLDEFDNFCIGRDRRIEDSQSARYVSRDTPGYDDLDDNGDWQPQSDYGPIWYPRQVPVGWAPYRYGHWVWTGPWGWTWVEDEPWGYAPFHYGRWVNYHDRWGWVPGPVAVRPIWSPALVAFVGGPGFGVAIGIGGLHAWFPLGPGEPYHPAYHCSERYVNQVNITNIHVTNIVHVQNNYYTTNVANVRYINREVGVTAVRGDAFAGGRPVFQNQVRVTPEQLRSTQVIAHPSIQPTVQSVVARPIRVAAVPIQRPTLLTQGGRQMQASPGARPTAVPFKPLAPNAMQNANQNQNRGFGGRPTIQPIQPPIQANRPIQPGQPIQPNQPGRLTPTQPVSPVQAARPPVQTPQPVPTNVRPAYLPAQAPRPLVNQQQQPPRPLVVHNEPPGPKPTFQQQQPVLNQHPGRPLEPQQIENMRQGQPAGRAVDPEFAPHANAVPQQRPAPPPARFSPPPPQRQAPPAPQRMSPPPQRASPPPRAEQPHKGEEHH